MMLSCGECLVLSAASGDRAREVEVGARDCVSVIAKFDACPVQD